MASHKSKTTAHSLFGKCGKCRINNLQSAGIRHYTSSLLPKMPRSSSSSDSTWCPLPMIGEGTRAASGDAGSLPFHDGGTVSDTDRATALPG